MPFLSSLSFSFLRSRVVPTRRRRLLASVAPWCWALLTSVAPAADRYEVDLSGAGWELWLDRAATWQDDALHFPTPAVASLPVNVPTGGWDALAAASRTAVSVPGTVEQYLPPATGLDGNITGVSWWSRKFELPAGPASRRVLLRFESVRERAEIFVNRRLVGYDIVGSTPLEVDITDAIGAGGVGELAVRVTDPAGNMDWRDSRPMRWGKQALPLSHGFGGITGRVRLVVCDPTYVDDVYVQNTPAITEAKALVTVRNTTGAAQRRDLEIRVSERGNPSQVVFQGACRAVQLPPGATVVPVKITAPEAQPWDIDNPRLYVCEATLRDGDTASDSDRRTFGFRWFAPDNIGTDAVFRLNGRRIVLRTAISWGFWPINGIFPTEELAEKQVRTAKAMGLNMLNFHRAIGNPVVLEKADELGLLYYEEPGAYKSVDGEPFGQPIVREKLLRMVRRDRSHPSLVIYNLINEWDSRNPNPDPAEIARHRADMAAAHQLDPSRTITHTSAWARGPGIDDPAKLHFRPFDDTAHWSGWYDVHHAGGPATWNESLYRNPAEYYLRTDNAREIVFWGEEGALSTPPRLEQIHAALNAAPQLGWDGQVYQDWFRAFEDFLARKNLRAAFPTVDALTAALGAVSFNHQGRRIENVRLNNVADGYAINGWEAEVTDNHSGVVDCFRNPKADPAILAYFNQPLYVAVKIRNPVVAVPANVVADVHVINEKNLHGPHQLRIVLRDPAGRELVRTERAVAPRGGDVFGELLAEAVELRVPVGSTGLCRVEATLVDPSGEERARGHDEVLAVDWRSAPIAGHGAVWESEPRVRNFLQRVKPAAVAPYTRGLGRLDWIIAARAPLEGEPTVVPVEVVRQPDGTAGWRTTFFSDADFRHAVHEQTNATIALAVDDGAAPDPALAVMPRLSVRWEAQLTPRHDGQYTFAVRTNGRVRLEVGGTPVIDFARRREPQPDRGSLELRAGVPVAVQLDFVANSGAAQCELGWVTPDLDPEVPAQLLERVRRDGTTLIVLERADAWMTLLAKEPDVPVRYGGAFRVGKTWLGGVHFVREHELFRDLPVNMAMDWPYQSVVRNGDERLGLLIEGEELAAGCYHCYPMQLGTAVGVFPLGRGQVIFSTLDIVANLDAPAGPADVARKLLCNYLSFAEQRVASRAQGQRPKRE